MDGGVSAVLSVGAVVAFGAFVTTALLVAVFDALAERSGRGWDKNGRPVWTGGSADVQRGDADAGNPRRSVAAPPLYQTDLDRHLWSWEGREARA